MPVITRLKCGTCSGYRKIMSGPGGKMIDCPDCEGMGSVLDTVAADNLAEILRDAFGGSNSAALALDVLDENRAALTGWLRSIGYLRPTTRALRRRRRDITLASWDPDYIPPGATEQIDIADMVDGDLQMFTVVDR